MQASNIGTGHMQNPLENKTIKPYAAVEDLLYALQTRFHRKPGKSLNPNITPCQSPYHPHEDKTVLG